jgi:hypothetical protein
MLKSFFSFLYKIIFADPITGDPSNTRFFANVGYGIWCVLFPYCVLKGIHTSIELWLIFGSVVIGNHTLNRWIQAKIISANESYHTRNNQ